LIVESARCGKGSAEWHACNRQLARSDLWHRQSPRHAFCSRSFQHTEAIIKLPLCRRDIWSRSSADLIVARWGALPGRINV